MQLVAYGAQDIYLTGNPQITFFKVVYRRHTNFSMEAILQTFSGSVSAAGSTITSTISRNGDLVSNLWLDVKMKSQGTADANAYAAWINNTGHGFINECEVEIGGQRIDRQYGRWLDIWNELSDKQHDEWLGLNKHETRLATLSKPVGTGATKLLQLYVPLKFWFCRNPGLALPLIALQYHEVKIKIKTRGMAGLIMSNGSSALAPAAPSVELWADYIYLDTDERRRFAQVSHEYLIEQLQQQTSTAALSNKLNFNHPVKELIWVFQNNTVGSEETTITSTGANANVVMKNVGGTGAKNDYFNYHSGASQTSEYLGGSESSEWFTKGKLQLNGHDRFAKRNATYFRTCQPVQAGHKTPLKHIYLYSFALKPEEHQPSGTCNFSRIDNAKLMFDSVDTTSTTLYIYAINYNVLRIMSGMGGLAYSN